MGRPPATIQGDRQFSRSGDVSRLTTTPVHRSHHACPNPPARKIFALHAYSLRAASGRSRFSHLEPTLNSARLRGPNGVCDQFHPAAATQNLRKLGEFVRCRKPFRPQVVVTFAHPYSGTSDLADLECARSAGQASVRTSGAFIGGEEPPCAAHGKCQIAGATLRLEEFDHDAPLVTATWNYVRSDMAAEYPAKHPLRTREASYPKVRQITSVSTFFDGTAHLRIYGL